MKGSAKLGVELNRRTFVQSLGAIPILGLVAHEAATAATPAPGLPTGIKTGNLASTWRVATDVADEGVANRWFDQRLAGAMAVPGSLEENRVGRPVSVETPFTGDINDRSWFTAAEYARYREGDDVKVPFILQPDTWYRGPAWFQREIEIPADWSGKRVELFLERPHWETQVWIDGRSLGRNDALHLPHAYDLGSLQPGVYRLTVRVDNRMIVQIGHNGHGVTDHTQGNWNGIVGRIELRATEPVWIDGVQLYPEYADRKLTVAGTVRRLEGAPAPRHVVVNAFRQRVRVPVAWLDDGTQEAILGEFRTVVQPHEGDNASRAPWDEFSPVLHDVSVRLRNGSTWEGRFGWRELLATPKGFRLNGRPLMFRGALDCCIFPLTGHPPTDLPSWQRIMQRMKDFGLNHLRFHSYCPPEAAFHAADEAGIYLQVETVWANQSAKIGSGDPVDQWVYAETDRILAAYGNHASLMLMTHGNEPGGGSAPDGDAKRDAFLAAYLVHYRAREARVLWTSGAGWPILEESQFHVTPTPRVQNWGEELNSRINARPPETRTDYRDFVGRYSAPVISHEIGQWCVYPDLNERVKYTGHLKAKNFDIYADRLRDNGILELAPDFLHASGRLQVMCYKEDIESALRTEGMGGFQLLGLQDFPGQGTALVGVVDPFWDDKSCVTAAEYRRFCSAVVPLVRMDSRIARSGAAFPFEIDVAHFGRDPIDQARIEWRIETTDGAVLAEGAFANASVPLGNAPLGLRAEPVVTVDKAAAARLVVRLSNADGLVAENDWDIWAYPPLPAVQTGGQIRRASQIDSDVLQYLEQGGDALIGLAPGQIANYAINPVKLGFSSIFWNTLWTQRQAPTTLGILCQPDHAALADFPSQSHSNWQWWYLIHRAGALRLDLLPQGVEPIVRIVDDWFTARPLGLVVEVAVGRGRAIICGFELDSSRDDDPVSKQLVHSLEAYMQTDKFRPATMVSADQLRALASA